MPDDKTAGMCVTCGRLGGLCRWADDAELCMRKQLDSLRATLWEIRRDIEECADDVVWMRGGIETVCDRINAVLGDRP